MAGKFNLLLKHPRGRERRAAKTRNTAVSFALQFYLCGRKARADARTGDVGSRKKTRKKLYKIIVFFYVNHLNSCAIWLIIQINMKTKVI